MVALTLTPGLIGGGIVLFLIGAILIGKLLGRTKDKPISFN